MYHSPVIIVWDAGPTCAPIVYSAVRRPKVLPRPELYRQYVLAQTRTTVFISRPGIAGPYLATTKSGTVRTLAVACAWTLLSGGMLLPPTSCSVTLIYSCPPRKQMEFLHQGPLALYGCFGDRGYLSVIGREKFAALPLVATGCLGFVVVQASWRLLVGRRRAFAVRTLCLASVSSVGFTRSIWVLRGRGRGRGAHTVLASWGGNKEGRKEGNNIINYLVS